MDIGRGTTTGAPGLIVNRPDRYGEMLSQIADRVNAGIYEPRTTREVTRYLNEETRTVSKAPPSAMMANFIRSGRPTG